MGKRKVGKSSTKINRDWKNRGYRVVDMELGDQDGLVYMYEKGKKEGIKRY